MAVLNFMLPFLSHMGADDNLNCETLIYDGDASTVYLFGYSVEF